MTTLRANHTSKRFLHAIALLIILVFGFFLAKFYVIKHEDMPVGVGGEYSENYRSLLGKVTSQEMERVKPQLACCDMPEYIDNYSYPLKLPSGKVLNASYSVPGPGAPFSGPAQKNVTEVNGKWVIMEGTVTGQSITAGTITVLSSPLDYYKALTR
ncbi:MAG: hypothetical protein K0S20_332 [Patescibacteria group bacterium]|jgi:hypothetical protein|nr:hypothetical protein [Patescibacteria group bacterium]